MLGFYPNGMKPRTVREAVMKKLFGREPEPPAWGLRVHPQERLMLTSCAWVMAQKKAAGSWHF